MTGFLYRQQRSGAPHPRFPVKLGGFRALHAPFLKERRTRRLVHGSVQEIRGISLVFREMWDTTVLDLKLCRLSLGANRISHIAALTGATYVVLPKENHMQLTEAATLDRKSGEADLSRPAVEGSAVPRTLPGNVFRQSS